MMSKHTAQQVEIIVDWADQQNFNNENKMILDCSNRFNNNFWENYQAVMFCYRADQIEKERAKAASH